MEKLSFSHHFVGALLFAFAASACQSEPAVSEPVDMAPGPRTPESVPSAIDWRPFERMNLGGSPGAAVLVLRGTEVVEMRAFGEENIETHRPITVDSGFNLASTSKQFTAMAALILSNRGQLDLRAPLSTLVPTLPAWAAKVRVEHLIHHTSGLPDYLSICDVGSGRIMSNEDVVSYLENANTLLFEPGSRYEYSNTGYAMLAVVVERASKRTFPDFLKEEIFRKLGMEGTVVFAPDNEHTLANRAIGYGAWPTFDTQDASDCNFIYGDGSMISNVRDYAKWLIALASPDALVDRASLDRIFQSGTDNDGKPVSYGFGWSTEVRSGFEISHGGSWIGYRSAVGREAANDMWFVVFSNSRGIDPWSLADRLAAPYR